MRKKNLNTEHIEGYVYQSTGLAMRESGESSKNPGTVYIAGDLEIAVDEKALNVITVHYTYVTATTKDKKANPTFNALKKIIESPEKTWLAGGKENALKVKIDTNLALNDFPNADGQMISAKRNEGGFVTIVDTLCEEDDRNKFEMDMVITRIGHVEANPEKGIETDYVTVSGVVFNFKNDILPVDFVVRNPNGMKYFEDLEVSEAEPIFTKVWGRINSNTVKQERTEESAFGEAAVKVYERKSREWVITGTAKVPYDFGDTEVLTTEDLTTARQNREVYLAEVKKRAEEYQASKAATTPAKATTPSGPAKNAGFTF